MRPIRAHRTVTQNCGVISLLVSVKERDRACARFVPGSVPNARGSFRMTCDGLILTLERVRDDPDIEPITWEMVATVIDAIEARARQIELHRLPKSKTDPKELAKLQAAIDLSKVPVGKLTTAIDQLTKGEPLQALLPHGKGQQLGPLRLPPTENLRPNQARVEENEYTGTILNTIPDGRRLELTNQKIVVVPPGQDFSVFAKGDMIKYRDIKPREVKRWVALPSLPIEIVPPSPDLFTGPRSPEELPD